MLAPQVLVEKIGVPDSGVRAQVAAKGSPLGKARTFFSSFLLLPRWPKSLELADVCQSFGYYIRLAWILDGGCLEKGPL